MISCVPAGMVEVEKTARASPSPTTVKGTVAAGTPSTENVTPPPGLKATKLLEELT